MSEGERQTIAAARRGDRAAFRRLVDAHARGIFPVCYRILGDAGLAEDAVQEALINAFRALDRFDERASFGTWLHRIAVNAALGLQRTRRNDDPLPEDDAPVTGSVLTDRTVAPSDLASGEQLSAAMSRSLQGLTAMERTAFVLRHLEQYALDEIAEVLGINVNACKQAIFRAVHKLRVALADFRTAV
jgi:RNA polymerase sigma-70 factor, ECF subfamily